MSTLSPTKVMSADTLIGMAVQNAAGEDLGEIKDLMLDLRHGKIAYAVLSFGGFLGFGDKLFAIPWDALTLASADNASMFILHVPRERLERAPGFDPEQWPDMADLTWAEAIHQYYGYKPYW
ncbi:hypothetical protein YTPLAS18_15160 [Nitrospira sp.]|nr:hypothetical protein YTPLAS18_15160 [Nitrospira sp.]